VTRHAAWVQPDQKIKILDVDDERRTHTNCCCDHWHRSQALDATLLHTVPFFCSHSPMHGMAWPVLWLTTCCGSNLVPTLHAYSYIYMWRQWTGRLDQKCRTEACAGKKKEKKRKEKELRGFLFALGNKSFFHLASHAREMSGAGEGEHQQQQRTSADMED
jgi:hypothetical protein